RSRDEVPLRIPGPAPVVDVRAGVLSELRSRRAQRASRGEIALWAGLAAAAALLTALAYDAVSDPFGPMMAAVSGESV
ncbi:MAG: hypothetical protein ACOYN0_11455, partial [Phycisphaerales bacterium]